MSFSPFRATTSLTLALLAILPCFALGCRRKALPPVTLADCLPNQDAPVRDFSSSCWMPGPELPGPFPWPQATLLENGRVLLTGGLQGPAGQDQPNAVLFSPVAGSFQPVGPMKSPRKHHVSVRLQNGQVFVALGQGKGAQTAELFDPASARFEDLGPLPGHITTLEPQAQRLADGRVFLLVSATLAGFPGPRALIFSPDTRRFTPTSALPMDFDYAALTLLPGGEVLLVGGWHRGAGKAGEREDIYRYDPVRDRFTPAGKMSIPRVWHTATLLPTGKVLICGGVSQGKRTPSAELYDPSRGSSQPIASLRTEYSHPTATLLPNGKVVVTDGSLTEFFDPATERWELGCRAEGSLEPQWLPDGSPGRGFLKDSAGNATEFLLRPCREYPALVVLPDGRLWMTGGTGIFADGQHGNLDRATTSTFLQ